MSLLRKKLEGAKELGGRIRGSCLEEKKPRPGQGKEGLRSDPWKLGTVKLLGDFGHILALLSLGFPMLQQEDRIVKCLRLPLALPFWASGVLKYPDLKEGAPELSVGLTKATIKMALQLNFSLCPVSFLSPPFHRHRFPQIFPY